MGNIMESLEIELIHLNDVRKILMENELMNMDYRIKVTKTHGYIPLKEKLNIETINEIRNILNLNENQIKETYTEFEKIHQHPKSMLESLKGKLDEKDIENIKTSFDTIGDIVILEIPEELENKKQIIGEATLNFTKRKSIYMKKSRVKGITRIRELELIAGENNPVTIHKEHNTRIKLDVTKVYFSPRLATERKRIADSVKDGEEILDMFTGVGPFPIIISKNKNAEITAVDINQDAIKYLKENIKLNKLKGKINPITGDILEVSQKQIPEKKFDRIIMNLPGTAYTFLDIAMKHIKNNGIINYYEFSDSFGQGIERLQESAAKNNKEVEIISNRKVKSSSPGMWHVGIDAKITDL